MLFSCLVPHQSHSLMFASLLAASRISLHLRVLRKKHIYPCSMMLLIHAAPVASLRVLYVLSCPTSCLHCLTCRGVPQPTLQYLYITPFSCTRDNFVYVLAHLVYVDVCFVHTTHDLDNHLLSCFISAHREQDIHMRSFIFLAGKKRRLLF